MALHTHPVKRIGPALALAGLGLLAGCAGLSSPGGAPPSQPVYRCDNGMQLSVQFVDDTVLIKGPRAQEVLLRDAGGQGPQQTVFSSPKLRAEFGLGSDAREAVLHYFQPPLLVRCLRE